MNVIRFRANNLDKVQQAFNGVKSLLESGFIQGGLTQIRKENSSYVFEACLNKTSFLPDGHFVISELTDKNYVDKIIKLFS